MIGADKIFYEWINANEYTFYLLNFFFSLGSYVYTKNDSMWEGMSFFIVGKGNWSLTGEGQSYMNELYVKVFFFFSLVPNKLSTIYYKKYTLQYIWNLERW